MTVPRTRPLSPDHGKGPVGIIVVHVARPRAAAWWVAAESSPDHEEKHLSRHAGVSRVFLVDRDRYARWLAEATSNYKLVHAYGSW